MKTNKSTQKTTMTLRVLVGLSFLLTAGVGFARSVNVDYDKDIDFSKYKTYAFAKGTPTPETLINQRIEQAIETQLSARGLTKVEGNADLTVVFHCAVKQQTQLDTTSLGGFGWGRGWRRWGGFGGGDAITQVEQIPIGTLIVDIADPGNKKYIWRGTATDTINSNPAKNAKTIDNEIKKMFQKYPPKEKK